ncbi:MAG: DegT/DnrJ/EryC1/StrS family aminotransferase [candidate division KSB1 bacterium]|nr:DegT/DnrJ/EryC1/StrS family aminotransferase [candidate division KSB1 bacterium]MDQ7062672.1 DegT/DnrJ/EryC1/StrS family aminotransferase [candidate division KSB1 bacterium]
MATTLQKRQIGVGGLKISARARQYVMNALDSNRLSIGKYVHTFEAEFARLHQRRFGIMANSGTSALQVALAAMKEKHGWQDGDEVIVPAITFIATSNIVLYNHMQPVFVDVDPLTYNIDPEKVEAAITPRTRAILPVHLFGLPSDMEPILEIAVKHNLAVLEDSCETMFVRYKGRPVGSFGEAACFSTYVAHILVTGVGGLALCDDPELAVICRSLIAHGRDSIYLDIDSDDNLTDNDLRDVIERRFSFVRLGHSFRPTEMEAALGLAQLEEYESILQARQRNARRLTEGLQDLAEHLQLPTIPPDREHAFMMYPITVKKPGLRNELVAFLENHGIETRFAFPLLDQPVYKKLFHLDVRQFPAAERISKNAFYIGCHQELTDEDIGYVIEVFHDFFRNGRYV